MKPVNLLFVFSLTMATVGGQELQRPNIVLMMADDMGLGDTSCYQDFTGNSDLDQVHTPGMERLAKMGIRFTDAHAPSSRCSPTRYGLLTGRYPWRNRLKYWVLFGAQGDPMIEMDRPTIATLLRDNSYHTGMVGKWHVGLRYRQTTGQPAAGFDDADFRMPLIDTPLDHGFDFCRFTSRSHGTSGPQPGRKNKPGQTVGPGHIHGRQIIGATANGRQLADEGPHAYVLKELGGRHADNALEFLSGHVNTDQEKGSPFFLYYPCNSNHSPYTPDSHVGDRPVAAAARSVAGEPMDARADFIYENDVALSLLLDWLNETDDPRRIGHKLVDNTIVIFTSDNGAERNHETATGPFRSNKGSCYEGGHRVPFMASWPAGKFGDGNAGTPGRTSAQVLCLTDMFATFADVLNVGLPQNHLGEKGAEDSISVLAALQGKSPVDRPLFFNDHKEMKADPAVVAMRLDNPLVHGKAVSGQWKVFFDASLLRAGETNPIELYDLATDVQEQNNRISEPELHELVNHLSSVALKHRTAGGHRLADVAPANRFVFDWRTKVEQQEHDPQHILLAEQFQGTPAAESTVKLASLTMTVSGVHGQEADITFTPNERGLGLSSGSFAQVDDGEALLFHFDRDVIVESAAIVAGNGQCGGFYRVGEHSPLAIYCVDADIDAKDQSGILSDIGVLKAGEMLRLDSSPHYAVESPGRWRLSQLTIRLLQK